MCPFKGLHLLSGPPPLHQRLGVKGSGAHGKLHLWEHFKDAGDSGTVQAKRWPSSLLANAIERVSVYFYISIMWCVFRLI